MRVDQEFVRTVTGLTRTFSGVKALDNVHLTVRKGEVHAPMGENGAGKSTFTKLLIDRELRLSDRYLFGIFVRIRILLGVARGSL